MLSLKSFKLNQAFLELDFIEFWNLDSLVRTEVFPWILFLVYFLTLDVLNLIYLNLVKKINSIYLQSYSEINQ